MCSCSRVCSQPGVEWAADTPTLITHVLADFHTRYEVALRWLYSLSSSAARWHARRRGPVPLPPLTAPAPEHDVGDSKTIRVKQEGEAKSERKQSLPDGDAEMQAEQDQGDEQQQEQDPRLKAYDEVLSAILTGLEVCARACGRAAALHPVPGLVRVVMRK